MGALRWPVTIARREQSPDAATSIIEGYVDVDQIWACIEPVGTVTYFEGIAVENGVTHYVETRWLDYLDFRHVFIRSRTRLDNTIRVEIFKIMKIGEKQGRQRRVLCACQLERRDQ